MDTIYKAQLANRLVMKGTSLVIRIRKMNVSFAMAVQPVLQVAEQNVPSVKGINIYTIINAPQNVQKDTIPTHQTMNVPNAMMLVLHVRTELWINVLSVNLLTI